MSRVNCNKHSRVQYPSLVDVNGGEGTVRGSGQLCALFLCLLLTAVTSGCGGGNDGGGGDSMQDSSVPSDGGMDAANTNGDSGIDATVGDRPSGDNTGWEHTGVTLTPSGNITVTEDGAVIDSVHVTGCIRVEANNVTIKRSKITSTCFYGISIIADEYSGLTIEDVEIDGNDMADDCINYGHYTARRVNLYNCADGAKIGDDTLIEDSYIHDLRNNNGCHCDGVQSTGGHGTTLRHNAIDVPGSNSAVMLGSEFGALGDITITENYLNSSNWTLYGGVDTENNTEPTNMIITNNRFGRDFDHGPLVYIGENTVVSGNVYDDTGEPIED